MRNLTSGPCKFVLPTFSHVSTHLIFFFIGNTNKGLVFIPSRRLNVDKTVLYNSKSLHSRLDFPFSSPSSPCWKCSCREPAIRTTGNPLWRPQQGGGGGAATWPLPRRTPFVWKILNPSSQRAIKMRRNWQRHHKEHVLLPLAKFSFIPTANDRWVGSQQTFQLYFLLPYIFRKK